MKTCLHCREPFAPTRGGGREQVYCTPVCRTRARRRRQRREINADPVLYQRYLKQRKLWRIRNHEKLQAQQKALRRKAVAGMEVAT
jgi:hypothetical protein